MKKISLSGLSLRDHFLSWQCRLRQGVVRHEGGRPSMGMRPRVTQENGIEIVPAITVLLIERDPGATTDTLRHIARKTHDLQQRREQALRILSSTYYQYPENFSDAMTASFAPESAISRVLPKKGCCVLDFHQHQQSYRILCTVTVLKEENMAYQATYWHNFLFNPTLHRTRILSFLPDWNAARAVPPV